MPHCCLRSTQVVLPVRSEAVKRRCVPIVLMLLLTTLAACGDGSSDQRTSAGGPEAGSSANGASPAGGATTPGNSSRDESNPPNGTSTSLAGVLPDTEIFDVPSGKTVELRSLVNDDQPLLVWFWAPHCPRCNREMPGLEAFARENPQVQVLGLGTQDSAEEAENFADRHDVTAAHLVWDSAFGTWDHFGVVAQPYGILYSPAGVELDRWTGEVNLDEVAALL